MADPEARPIQLGIGLTLGLAGAYGLSQVLESVIVQVTPGDPVTFIAISSLMIAVALTACLLPARRATRVDPLVALRPDCRLRRFFGSLEAGLLAVPPSREAWP